MSTNAKNIVRPEILKNYTKNVEKRLVLFQDNEIVKRTGYEGVAEINTCTNQIIQELNLKILDRNIPYITLNALYSSELTDNNTRMVLRDYHTEEMFEEKIKENLQNSYDISHLVDFLCAPGFREVTISSVTCDAQMVIDGCFLKSASVDVLLDISMFNSYSFLRKLSIQEKKKINKYKYEYFKNNNLDCYYTYKENKPIYYSLAFSARENESAISIEKYISLWNGFIEKYYSGCLNEEKTVKEQLQQHVDYGELPKKLHKKITDMEKGTYLILRTNKDKTESIHPEVCSIFGLNKYDKGKIKIVPISNYQQYHNILENLDVSAFKVINI